MTLLAAASALEALAAGLEPRLGDVLSGALVLQSLVVEAKATGIFKTPRWGWRRWPRVGRSTLTPQDVPARPTRR